MATDVYLLFLYTSVGIFLAIYPTKLLSAGQRTDDCWPTYSCMMAGIQLYAAHRTIAPFCRTGKTHYKSIGIWAHLQSSVFKLSKDLIDSIHEEGIVAYTS